MRRVSTFGRSGDVVPASTPAVYRIRDMPTILPRSVSVPTQQGLSASRSGICPGSAIPLVGSVNARQGRPGPRRQLRIPPPRFRPLHPEAPNEMGNRDTPGNPQTKGAQLRWAPSMVAYPKGLEPLTS